MTRPKCNDTGICYRSHIDDVASVFWYCTCEIGEAKEVT